MSEPYFIQVPGTVDLGLTVNLPSALAGVGVHGLPPYAPVSAYKVDKYPAAPTEWPRSTSTLASYFIPITAGKGMWLDFNKCANHKHHVAIVVSIQGINPLTGRKADKLELERYPDDDTVETWLRGRQNYLATTSTPNGMLWIDGFRGADGSVRQYVFTKDESKGVASQLIGVDRVFAIGVAFFLSKDPKPVQQTPGVLRGMGVGSKSVGMEFTGFYGYSGAKLMGSADPLWLQGTTGVGDITGFQGVPDSHKVSYTCCNSIGSASERGASCFVNAVAEPFFALDDKLEIAAGALIEQQLYRDTVSADYWQAQCAGVVAISYAPEALVEKILAGGVVEEKEGFLAGLDVGNVQ